MSNRNVGLDLERYVSTLRPTNKLSGLALNESVDNYCERIDPSFWSEPTNALTNLAFIIAAVLAVLAWRRSTSRPAGGLFLGLWIAVIGFGSFLFHTFATRWAGAVDTLPILVFILVCLYLALRHYLALPIWAAAAAAAAFVPASVVILPVMTPLAGSSAGYLPALFAILAVGFLARGRDVAVSVSLLITGIVFFISIGFRMADEPICAAFPLGTHFMWHMLNAVVLYRLTVLFMSFHDWRDQHA